MQPHQTHQMHQTHQACHADAHPQPQFSRPGWLSLNGVWEFAFDDEGKHRGPDQVHFDKRIVVPFAPETEASGIHDTGFHHAFWYRKRLDLPALPTVEARTLLHFGAVDYATTVWVNGRMVAEHRGGYTPFCVDITDALQRDQQQCIVVRAEDDPHDLTKPRGKQDWQLRPHHIWYYRMSGIWQTVWLETVNKTHIGRVRWIPNLQRWEIGMEAAVAGVWQEDMTLEVSLRVGDRLLVRDRYSATARDVTRRIALSDPGIDDFRNEILWSPDQPTLIHAELALINAKGQEIDKVWSYTALRSIALQGDRFLLNGRPLTLRFLLDQGIWDKTGFTAPDDAALRKDVELVKAMGFNGVRKHQKIEDPRYLYWADRLGLMVWEEMPSAYRFTFTSVQNLIREWMEVMDRDISHPCIVAWVPFNESWGVPDLPNVVEHRHYVQTLYHLTKTIDPDRPVIGNDGWESVATDIITVHDYDQIPELLQRRYTCEEPIPNLFKNTLPAGRVISLADTPTDVPPIMLTEFGGVAVSNEKSEKSWGYVDVADIAQFKEQFRALIHAVRGINLFAGYCYTQFTDTYQEANGLLYSDRTPKIPLEEIRQILHGR